MLSAFLLCARHYAELRDAEIKDLDSALFVFIGALTLQVSKPTL